MNISFEVVKILESTNVTEVYVESGFRLSLINDFTAQTIKILNDPTLTTGERLVKTENIQRLVFNMATDLGVQGSTIQLANSAIDSMIYICYNNKSLTRLINRITENKHGFMYQHCLLTTYLSFHLISQTKWGTKEQLKIMTFVAFFHDIALLDESYHDFKTDDEVESSNLTDEEKRKVLDHAALSASVVNKFNAIPFGVGTIIKQHHGNKSGRSISKLSQVLSPIAAIFVVAENWADMVISYEKRKEKLTKEKVLKALHQKLPLRHFEKIIQLINKIDI